MGKILFPGIRTADFFSLHRYFSLFADQHCGPLTLRVNLHLPELFQPFAGPLNCLFHTQILVKNLLPYKDLELEHKLLLFQHRTYPDFPCLFPVPWVT